MIEKKQFYKMAVCFVLCMGILGGFVWFVDPFYHYHEPFLNMPVVLDNAVYQTAGAAKNLTYNSAIIGTSMTENMHTSWFDDEMGWTTMKLSYSGARSNDLQAIFGEIARKEDGLKNVVMDINDYQLSVPSWTKYVERPEYLYDEYLYNDYEYLYNHDVIVRSVERCIDGLMGVEDNIDIAYTWEEDALFGREIVRNTFAGERERLLQEKGGEANAYQLSGKVSDELPEKLKVCQENLDNITPFIELCNETDFYIMIPPYSMLYWEEKALSGSLEDTMAIYVYAIQELLQYENVKIYYFQNEPMIVTNLDNYRDSCHHRPEINRYMFECIRDGRNLLTADNYEEKMTAMYEFAANYSYGELWTD